MKRWMKDGIDVLKIAAASGRTGAFLFSAAGFLLGVAFFFLFSPDIFLSSLFLVSAAALAAFSLRKASARRFLFAAVFLFFVFLGVARAGLSPNVTSPAADALVGGSETFLARVVAEPDERESRTLLHVRILSVFRGNESVPLSSEAMIFADNIPRRAYGDLLLVRGALEKPERFSSAGGEFDYPAFLARKGIGYVIYRPRIALADAGTGNPIRASLFALKRKLVALSARFLPEPHNSLYAGITFGMRRALGEDILADFRTTGLSHIVVLSGYNVAVVAAAIYFLLSPLSLAVRSLIAAGAIVAFAVMVGGEATVVRASAMALIALFARATGREHAGGAALLLAGVGMVAANPRILLFDPSFQLSFLAAFGVIYVAPRLESVFWRIPDTAGLRAILAATVAAQIMVMPPLLRMAGEISLSSLPANLLVLPAVPLTMLFGFLTSLFAAVFPPVAAFFAAGAYALLSYELAIASFLASLPFSSVSPPRFFIPVFLVASYGLVFFLLARFPRAPEKKSV